MPGYQCMLSQYSIPLCTVIYVCIKPFNVREGKYLCHEELACLLAKYVFTAFVALSQEKSIDFTKQECLINESGPTVPAYSRI